MAEEISSPKRAASPGVPSLRRAFTVDESAQLRHRLPKRTSSIDGPTNPTVGRRRSSNISEYSLNEVRKQFQSSTDDLLLPRPSSIGQDVHPAASHWHSAPLAFALLPAIGGMLFKNGSSVVTDVTLLGLAAIFLNWSVRIPWDWYHSAQTTRKKEEFNAGAIVEEESGDENNLDTSQASLDKDSEEPPNPKLEARRIPQLPEHKRASNELYIHEILALLSCFLFPMFGAYLLHSIRGSLSRPSEGLVSNYNLTIFLLASEVRPVAHLVKLIQFRTLHLQRVVNSNPHETVNAGIMSDFKAVMRRLEELEARTSAIESAPTPGTPETTLNGKQTAVVTTEVRRSLQPELDALNRAVRRYEKRATIQTMQTESRLSDIEARLTDAISLAAAAAQNGQQRYGFVSLLVEWIAAGLVLPLQAVGVLASLPFKTTIALIDFGKVAIAGRQPAEKGRRSTNWKSVPHGRFGGDRVQGKGPKR